MFITRLRSARHWSLMIALVAFIVCSAGVQAVYADKPCPSCGPGATIGDRDLCLLEPTPGGVCYIPASTTGNMGAFFTYINQGIWGWAFGVAIGIAVLNGTVAGFQIMLGDRDSGKERFMWSTIGLLVLLLAGVILAFINPAGFSPA